MKQIQVVSASWDRSATIWQIEMGTSLRTFYDYDGELTHVACHQTKPRVIMSSLEHHFILVSLINSYVKGHLRPPYVFIKQKSTILFRPSASINLICSIQTLSLQIFPFFLLLGYNVHFAHQWLFKTTKNSNKKTCLISISSFLIFCLAILIQTGVLLIWFYNYHNYQDIFDQCTDQCYRALFLCSLSFNFFLLFLFSLQSSIRFHLYSYRYDLIYLLTSLLALCVTITWICLYLFSPLRSLLIFHMNNNYILAYGNLLFVYTFLGPFLFEQLFYQPSSHRKGHVYKSSTRTFKCLSLTKEQQRVFMAAYIKRNLTASCENLTTITISSPVSINKQNNQQSSHTCHSTLSADSLCPTLASIVSRDLPPKILPNTTTDTSSCGTMTSEYLLLPTSTIHNNEMI